MQRLPEPLRAYILQTKNPMNYYRIKVNHGRGSRCDVYYKNPLNISSFNVPKEAVIDKMMIDVDLRFVEKVEVISTDEYHTYMWD